MDIKSLEKELYAAKDGLIFGDIKKLIKKKLSNHRDEFISMLAQYAKEGPLGFKRTEVMSDLADIVEENEKRYSEIFLVGLEDEKTAYWAVEGLIKTDGAGAYKTLTSFATETKNPLDARANAVQGLARHSLQTFIQGRPANPGHWKENDLPLKDLKEWAQKGYPKGKGFKPPITHSSLMNPKSELEKVAAALEKKLAKARAKEQDLANPDNWLVPGDPVYLKAIQAKWELPKLYIEFLTMFSPLKVVLSAKGIGSDIEIFGASNLIEGQNGYSFNPETDKPILDWPEKYVAIANESGDPYVLDLSAIKDGDAPVLNATHGHGKWDFLIVCPSFLRFLEKLGK